MATQPTFKFDCGDVVADRLNGYTGVVTSRTNNMGGSNNYTVEPAVGQPSGVPVTGQIPTPDAAAPAPATAQVPAKTPAPAAPVAHGQTTQTGARSISEARLALVKAAFID